MKWHVATTISKLKSAIRDDKDIQELKLILIQGNLKRTSRDFVQSLSLIDDIFTKQQNKFWLCLQSKQDKVSNIYKPPFDKSKNLKYRYSVHLMGTEMFSWNGIIRDLIETLSHN